MHNPPTRLQAPPRPVPVSLRIINFFNGATQFGWIFLGFGLVGFCLFGLQSDLSIFTFRNATGRVAGRVTSTEETGASENDQRVHASRYEYSVAGNMFDGTAYSSGFAPKPGEPVTVEYVETDPDRSRVAGMRRAHFGFWAAPISSIFPLIGLIIVIAATQAGMRRNRLLRDGMLASGVLKKKRPTSMIVNRRTVWELTFEFTDRHGQRHETTVRTSNPSDLADEATEPLLYDPDDPSRVYLLDDAPARPRFDIDGALEGRSFAAIASLIIPLLIIGSFALYYANRWGLLPE